MGWLIDPNDQAVFTYHRDQPTSFHDQANKVLPTPEFAQGFELTVSELFSWLVD